MQFKTVLFKDQLYFHYPISFNVLVCPSMELMFYLFISTIAPNGRSWTSVN